MIGLWSRLSLLQRYSAVSAVIAMVLAVVLSEVTVRAIESSTMKDEAKIAAELVLQTITPQLQPSDFSNTLPDDRRKLLDGLFRAHGISDRVLRIRLWRVDGRLLYSNVPEPTTPKITGIDLSRPRDFERLVKRPGLPESTAPNVLRFVPVPKALGFLLPVPDVVRFFVPVVGADKRKPLAAFEIFYDLTYLRPHLSGIRRTVWTAVPLGIVVFYAAVFVLVRRASQRLLKQQADLIEAHVGTFESLASAIDAKDSYTGDHSITIAALAVQVARALKLPAEMFEDVRMSARLHDLGKIGVPDAILQKPGPLNPDELVVMRNHAERGFEILVRAPLSDRVKLAVRHSHERWDGNGYPEGLSGEAIPLMARIVAVVDAYDAMTGDRPYRKGMPILVALQRLEQGTGTHFDPRIADVFIQLMKKTATLKASGPRAAVSS
jgi:HD-GYP domain-containing protein (c-di-GMP phosphodiesterase class II)